MRNTTRKHSLTHISQTHTQIYTHPGQLTPTPPTPTPKPLNPLQASPLIVLHELYHASELARAAAGPVWANRVGAIYGLLRPLLHHHDAGVREHAVLVVRNLAVWQGDLLDRVLEPSVKDLVRLARDPTGEVTALADEALQAMVRSLDSERMLDTLLAHQKGVLRQSDAPENMTLELQSSVKAAGKIMSRLPGEVTLRWVPRFLPYLTAALNYPVADVRKAAVFALVDAWSSAGDTMRTYLEPSLKDSQMRLVEIYLARTRGAT